MKETTVMAHKTHAAEAIMPILNSLFIVIGIFKPLN